MFSIVIGIVLVLIGVAALFIGEVDGINVRGFSIVAFIGCSP